MSTDDDQPNPKLTPEDLFHPGTIAERVEVQLGVLTQGVIDCMIFATGAFPSFTEGTVPEQTSNPYAPYPHKQQAQSARAGSLTSWQAARSAELRDAARLSEATASLLTGFAKLRGQFSQDFTIRHNEKRKAGDPKSRLRNTTISHSFSVPAREAVSVESVDPATPAGLTGYFAKVTEGLAPDSDATKKADGEAALNELYRRFGVSRDEKDDGADEEDADDAPSSGSPPPPPPGS